ncbi:MAG: phospholipid/cholesterol/gamma-HCH transport system substrate-binding protein [Solirubrobacterales bacterium]|jgi:phospholipid/cholesterol/gamma-HCH transport system substrate-binding protein|nr:phospholipid/cholesterol/gamma-HCH transport system substrate-binding protein [Solirubrobacterales bacterium]
MRSLGLYLKLGAFVLVALFFGVGLFTVYSDARFYSTNTYHALFDQVSGLKAGRPVREAGVRVGQVTDVHIVQGRRALVTFTTRSDLPVMSGTRSVVRYENLIGDRYLELTDGPGDLRTLPPGGTIPLAQTEPALDLDVLLNGFQPLFQGLDPNQVNQVATEIVQVLQGEGGTIDNLLGSVASLTSDLADRDQVIGQVITNLNVVLGTLDQHRDQLSNTVLDLQRLVSGLARDRGAIGDSLSRINGAAGSVANLLSDARPDLRGTITQTNRLATLLDDNRATVDGYLGKLPGDYARLARAGAYGSFFNFYLCGVRLKLDGPDGNAMYTPWFDSNAQTSRCGPVHQ